MLSGYLLSLLFVLLLTTGIFLFGYAARKASVLFVTAAETLVGLVLVTPIVLFADRLSPAQLFTRPDAVNWLWLGAAAMAGFIGGNYFSIINLKAAGEKLNSLLSPAITACVVAAGAFFLDDDITIIKVVGIVVTLLAIFTFLLYKDKNRNTASLTKTPGLWSGIVTVLCITASIICSVKAMQHTQLSIMHSIWLRLLMALPVILVFLLLNFKNFKLPNISFKLYAAIAGGVIAQTIIGAWLWFCCTKLIGLSTFQVLIATLPFFVYAADVYLLRRTKPSPYFLITAVAALLGIWLVK